MKKFRRTASLLLAIAMVFALSVTAFAAAPDSEANGTITITGAVDGQTYSIYRIFDLESYSGDAYSYKVNDTWGEWARTQATQYVKVDEQGYVTWVKDADPAKFAKLALDHAKANPDLKVDSKPATAAGSVEFTGLDLGYYLVDSSLGALCGLNTTNSSVNIKEKNTAPTIDKQVQEGDQWGDTNDAKIGDTVNFKTVVHAQPGAENYVVHDKMSAGLTLDENSIAIADLTKGNEYTVETTGLDDGCTFEITFTKTYLDTITADIPITITYSAVLNDKAVIAGEGNTNETYLSYGDSSHTEVAKTATKTYQFQLVKTDQDKKVLDGAKFELYDVENGGTAIPLVDVTGSAATSGNNIYRVATDADTTTTTVIQAGQATIQGLDGNTSYYLQETKAPDGYNKLKDRVKVDMKQANLDATVNIDTYVDGGVQVVNQTGAILPSTGGIGTTIFYVVGGVMVAAAVILLITKKRMGSAE